MSQSIASPENQNVTFIELFFDLVFVFAVTQLVFFLHDDLSLETGIKVLLIFWLVWWSWSQFTWTLNAANTKHPAVELTVLLVTAVVFFMAISIPNAFQDQALWFAVTYVITRMIGLSLYGLVASENKTQLQAIKTYGFVSIGGLLAVVLGAIVGGEMQLILWGSVLFLDLVAASVGAKQDGWNLYPEHFSERHGLFVIIALGETLIVAAGGVTGAVWTNELLMVTILSVALTCSLWWSYFSKTKPILDHALENKSGTEQAIMAKDVFSLLHFPILLGVITYATVVEEAIAHPDRPLSLEGRILFALSMLLFVGVMGLALWKVNANGSFFVPRLGLSIVLAVIILLLETETIIIMTIALAGIFLLLVIENRTISLHSEDIKLS